MVSEEDEVGDSVIFFFLILANEQFLGHVCVVVPKNVVSFTSQTISQTQNILLKTFPAKRH